MSGAPRVWRALSERLDHHALHGVLPKLGDEAGRHGRFLVDRGPQVEVAGATECGAAVTASPKNLNGRCEAFARLALRLQAVLFLTAARSPFPAGSVAEYAS
jgi:hypothetical protein